MTDAPHYIDGPHGRIAYRQVKAGANGVTGVVWLGGFRSDMLGTKAEFVDQWARKANRNFLRFDYSGHGESDGQFEAGCIGEWSADALAVFDELTEGPQILIGSSMGGWVATLLALKRPERIAAIVFIAPAPDFTERLMWRGFSKDQQRRLMNDGRLEQPSDYSDEPEIITRKLIEDGRNHLVMTGSVPVRCPVRILQGMKDDAVPYAHALEFAEMLESDDVAVALTRNGDHRLSTPEDLERLAATLDQLPV